MPTDIDDLIVHTHGEIGRIDALLLRLRSQRRGGLAALGSVALLSLTFAAITSTGLAHWVADDASTFTALATTAVGALAIGGAILLLLTVGDTMATLRQSRALLTTALADVDVAK